MGCEDCQFESDGVPDCVIDGCCPLEVKMEQEEELNKIKIVLLALWDKSPHPEAQDIIKKYRDEIARRENEK